MKKLPFFFLMILLQSVLISCNAQNKNVPWKPAQLDTTKTLTTIAFGSCNKQDLDQPLWPLIQQNKPDLWVWLGDIIYADTEDMEVMKAKYEKQKQNENYASFAQTVPAIGVWDDHDYGANDGGKNYSKKKESKQLMLDFLNVPANAPQRKREGAFSSYTFGANDKQVKIILLDDRYFRDSLIKTKGGCLPNTAGDILGEAQWKWLEDELKNSKASINIIGEGIEIIPEEQPYEKWANFPLSRKRFFEVIEKTQAKGIVLLSGDRHLAEISAIKLNNYPDSIYEVTSSGLTHSGTIKTEINKYRKGDLISKLNFGLLQIDWNKHLINLEVRGVDNVLYLNELVKFK